ncbi:hypothetical protein Dsin_029487 [Dipteronia sinensis]|uniref:RNase H type-1 domain-containing protein n=1 Tax=Dipteronia sinensis TaxID=43782 RepID=A0AAE0DVJ1_9ROSI|nr:hypothetical protein Dsin_029487 [Dipteronia sinensis]
MLALSWNIRGFGRQEKKRAARELVKRVKPTIMFIQETKLNKFDNQTIKALGGSMLSRGSKGSLLLTKVKVVKLHVEGLSCLLSKVIDLQFFKGAAFGNNEVHISHFQFADDTILFLKPKMEYSLNAKRLLSEAISLILLDVRHRCVDNLSTPLNVSKVWKPTVSDALFFNVDGSAKGNPSMAEIGGVLKDSSGRTLCLFSAFPGIRDPISAEILSIQRACQLVSSNKSLHNRIVTIISDSKAAVEWTSSDSFGSLKHIDRLFDI